MPAILLYQVLFTGTLGQMGGVISSNANGLASRFIKVILPSQEKFINQWNHDEKDVKEQENAVAAIGDIMQTLWVKLECTEDGIEIHYTKEQGDYVTEFFDRKFRKYDAIYGEEFKSIIMRMGMIHIKICMVLTMLRQTCVADLDKQLSFSDTDIKNALKMISVLIEHSAYAFRMGCNKKQDGINYDYMPVGYKLEVTLGETFTTTDALNFGSKLGMSKRTVERWLKDASDNNSENGLLIRKIKHGMYKKNKSDGVINN